MVGGRRIDSLSDVCGRSTLPASAIGMSPSAPVIDKAGRQLPYIGTLMLEGVPRAEIPARTAAGESDLQATGLTPSDDKLLAEAAKKGGPQLRLWPSGRGSQYALYPNLNSKDKGLVALLRDVRFRRALSLAIDRVAINKALYDGAAMPRANTVLPDSPLFNAV